MLRLIFCKIENSCCVPFGKGRLSSATAVALQFMQYQLIVARPSTLRLVAQSSCEGTAKLRKCWTRSSSTCTLLYKFWYCAIRLDQVSILACLMTYTSFYFQLINIRNSHLHFQSTEPIFSRTRNGDIQLVLFLS